MPALRLRAELNRIRVLLLTNRDSDNVGDQIIEASVISLLKTVAANLDLDEDSFEISSRAAGIISKKYMKTGDESLLKSARKAISKADILEPLSSITGIRPSIVELFERWSWHKNMGFRLYFRASASNLIPTTTIVLRPLSRL